MAGYNYLFIKGVSSYVLFILVGNCKYRRTKKYFKIILFLTISFKMKMSVIRMEATGKRQRTKALFFVLAVGKTSKLWFGPKL